MGDEKRDPNDILRNEGPEGVIRLNDYARKWRGQDGRPDVAPEEAQGGEADTDCLTEADRAAFRASQRASKREPAPPRFSDEALALDFAARHAGELRYVALWGQWLLWTGTHWRADSTLHAFDLSRQIARESAATCKQKKIATQIASAKTVAAVERLAKADRRLAATDDQWDGRLSALNTPTI